MQYCTISTNNDISLKSIKYPSQHGKLPNYVISKILFKALFPTPIPPKKVHLVPGILLL